MNKDRKFLVTLGLAAIPFGVALIFLLTAVFGPPSVGVKCWRRNDDRQCAVLQSRFFGLIGNGSVLIPESDIERAVTVQPVRGVGSRGSGSYTLSLELKRGPYRHYPVLSSERFEATDASTRELNAYLADPSARSIQLHENMWASVLIPFIPVAVAGVALVTAARWRRRRSDS